MAEEVFISYGSADRERIQDLVSRMRQAGVTVWIDEAGIEGAAMWSEEIVGAINQCKVLILAISSNSTKSKNVVRELALASEEEKTILPVFIEPTEIPESMKYQLAGIQRVEYFAGNEEEAIGSVLRSLSRLGITTKAGDINQTLGQAPFERSQARKKRPNLAIAVVTLIALLAIVFLLKSSGDQPPNAPGDLTAKPETAAKAPANPLDKNRIVLLPFKNIGTPGENDHIVEGIVDDLNTMLTNVEGLRVIGSASAKTYRNSDKTPAEIGQELNAGTLLQGSIQKTDSDLKINVRLIDTTTSENIWANSFSGSENDRSKFQQEIIQSIVNKTKGTILNQSELSSLSQGDTKSAEAYKLLKEGVDLLKGHSREGTQRAIDLMLKAIKLDSNYSNAHMGLARAYQLSSSLSLHEPTTAFNLSKKHGRKALEINPNLPGFEIIKITFSQDGQRDPEEMMNRLNLLLKKYPNNSDLLREAGDIFSFSGRNQKAIETLHQGLKLDPKNAWFHQYLAYTHLITRNKKLAEHHNAEALKLKPNFQFALHIRSLILSSDNRFDEIESELLKAIQDDAQNPVTIMSLGIVYWRSGQKEKSYKLLAELLDRRNFEYIKSGILARFYIAIGEKKKSLKWLQQSSKESDTDFVDLFHWPLFDEVRADPDFIKIYKDAGIYEHYTTGSSK